MWLVGAEAFNETLIVAMNCEVRAEGNLVEVSELKEELK